MNLLAQDLPNYHLAIHVMHLRAQSFSNVHVLSCADRGDSQLSLDVPTGRGFVFAGGQLCST